jgi:hypothetical protein
MCHTRLARKPRERRASRLGTFDCRSRFENGRTIECEDLLHFLVLRRNRRDSLRIDRMNIVAEKGDQRVSDRRMDPMGSAASHSQLNHSSLTNGPLIQPSHGGRPSFTLSLTLFSDDGRSLPRPSSFTLHVGADSPAALLGTHLPYRP